MASSEEKVAHIETAFRRRFFQYVPRIEKPQRTQWTEENHDTDRLTRALAAYAVGSLAGLDDVTASGAVIDDDNDGGIDSICFDRGNNRLIIVQSKFKRTGTAPSQAENLKTINGVRALVERRFQEFNTHFHRQLDEIEEALDMPGIILEVVLAYLGNNLGPHVSADLNALQNEMNTITERVRWSAFGLDQIYDKLVAEQRPSAVSIESLPMENWAFIRHPRRALYGQISAGSLARLVDIHGKALFERNIRHYLGSIGVNTAIYETVLRRPTDLFYLNNGLTAVAKTITPAAGNQTHCNFGLEDFSIVNGAQTAGAIASAASAGDISPNAKLLITIIEIGDNPDDIGTRITRARNHQNAVRGIDFAALDPIQEKLRQEVALLGLTYHYRPSAEARTRREDAFTLEEAALALACLSFPVMTIAEIDRLKMLGRRPLHAIDFVISAKKEIGRLWDQDGSYYRFLFTRDLSGVKLCRFLNVYRLIDQVLTGSEYSEWRNYFRRMFFRHGRYYIMAFIAHRSGDVLNRAGNQLSIEEKSILSRRINEISELIYAESVQLQGDVGYLSVFRNFRDSLPLADRVLARLALQDQADGQPARV